MNCKSAPWANGKRKGFPSHKIVDSGRAGYLSGAASLPISIPVRRESMAVGASASRGMSKQERRNFVVGMLFISPWLLGFLFFAVYPLISSFYYSMTNFDFIRQPQFIGLKNYQRLFTT